MPQKKSARQNRTRKRYLVDTGPILSLFNEQDAWHGRSLEFFGGLDFDLVTTEAVIHEVIYFLQKARKPSSVIERLLENVSEGSLIVYFLKKAHFERIKHLKIRYADQPKLDYADMTLVVAAEDLRLSDIITIDVRDFQRLHWNRYNSFNVILPTLEGSN
ncbi:MAG: PIN domain-containing protein [Cyanobacteria bacterium SZAS LIN-3]|nr:PIN domain-containing protein [Cyanobacteria bacterium SZAS LIN-3]